LLAAEAYITQQWRQFGYEVNKQSYQAYRVECSNLDVLCLGKQGGNGYILIGAHYDSVSGSPGANDNASAVAALLELSRVFKDNPPPVNLRFVAFVNEEPPFFFWNDMGSMKYAKAAKQRGDNIRFMISLEMLGYYDERQGSQFYPPLLKYFYPDRGNFIAFVSNLKSRSVMRDCVNAFKRASDFPVESLAAPAFVPGVALSDHLSFWRYGYKAMMITDTAYYRYPYYHTAQDTPDKLIYPAFAKMANDLLIMLNSFQ
jgi:Zn-dependent M28 family amino/carboxypeptidase